MNWKDYGQDDAVWVIRHLTEPFYWSNEWGWVYDDLVSLFTAQEHATFNLPVGGIWERW